MAHFWATALIGLIPDALPRVQPPYREPCTCTAVKGSAYSEANRAGVSSVRRQSARIFLTITRGDLLLRCSLKLVSRAAPPSCSVPSVRSPAVCPSSTPQQSVEILPNCSALQPRWFTNAHFPAVSALCPTVHLAFPGIKIPSWKVKYHVHLYFWDLAD